MRISVRVMLALPMLCTSRDRRDFCARLALGHRRCISTGISSASTRRTPGSTASSTSSMSRTCLRFRILGRRSSAISCSRRRPPSSAACSTSDRWTARSGRIPPTAAALICARRRSGSRRTSRRSSIRRPLSTASSTSGRRRLSIPTTDSSARSTRTAAVPRSARLALAGRGRQGIDPRIVARGRRRLRLRRRVRRQALRIQRTRLWRGALPSGLDRNDRRHDRIVADRHRRAFSTSGPTTASSTHSRPAAAAGRPARRSGPAISAARYSNSTPAVSNGVVYMISQHALSAFDAQGCGAQTCAPLWQAVDEQQFFNGSPAIAYGRIYAGLESGLAVYAADGCGAPVCSPLWLLFGAGFQAAVESSPTVANGVVYAGRNTGEVLAWPAEPCGDFVCENIWTGLTTRRSSTRRRPSRRQALHRQRRRLVPGGISGRVYVFELP